MRVSSSISQSTFSETSERSISGAELTAAKPLTVSCQTGVATLRTTSLGAKTFRLLSATELATKGIEVAEVISRVFASSAAFIASADDERKTSTGASGNINIMSPR